MIRDEREGDSSDRDRALTYVVDRSTCAFAPRSARSSCPTSCGTGQSLRLRVACSDDAARRMVPITRSQYGFCHGDRGAES
jgi:hypothetical protein